jgi:hypothetical protein
MIFAMARPIEVFRIHVAGIKKSNGDSQWTIPTHRKTDKGVQTSLLTIIALPDKRICPVAYFEELLRRAETEDLPVFHWDNGNEINSMSGISAALKVLLEEAGISRDYKPYSIRHAAITKLFLLDIKTPQINAFTGHSDRANTAPKFYLHRQENWLGFQIAKAAPTENQIVQRINEDGSPVLADSRSEDEKNSSDSNENDSEDIFETLGIKYRSVSPLHTKRPVLEKRKKKDRRRRKRHSN